MIILGFLAGVLGALVMSIFAALARDLDLTSLNMEMMLGSFFTHAVTPSTWVAGFVSHLLMGGLFGIGYAALFETVHSAGMKLGAGFGALHWLFAGVVLGLFQAVHPLIPGQLPAPGYFAANLGGIAFLGFLFEHVLYGAIVGGLLGLNASRGMMRIRDDSQRSSGFDAEMAA